MEDEQPIVPFQGVPPPITPLQAVPLQMGSLRSKSWLTNDQVVSRVPFLRCSRWPHCRWWQYARDRSAFCFRCVSAMHIAASHTDSVEQSFSYHFKSNVTDLSAAHDEYKPAQQQFLFAACTVQGQIKSKAASSSACERDMLNVLNGLD